MRTIPNEIPVEVSSHLQLDGVVCVVIPFILAASPHLSAQLVGHTSRGNTGGVGRSTQEFFMLMLNLIYCVVVLASLF